MKAFIERVFMSKKKKQEELLNENTTTNTAEQATEAAVEAIIKEVKDTYEQDGFIDRKTD